MKGERWSKGVKGEGGIIVRGEGVRCDGVWVRSEGVGKGVSVREKREGE